MATIDFQLAAILEGGRPRPGFIRKNSGERGRSPSNIAEANRDALFYCGALAMASAMALAFSAVGVPGCLSTMLWQN